MTTRSLDAKLYTKDYYLHECGGFREFLEGSVAPRLQKALDLAYLKAGMRILDIGCGRGELASKCAEMGCDAWGIDYSVSALDIASLDLHETASPESHVAVSFSRMNAKTLSFPSGTFDRVFLIDVVEHLYPEELSIVLREVRRVARRPCRVVIHTAPNAWLIKPIYMFARLVINWQKQVHHVNEQSYFSLRQNLAMLGGTISVHFDKSPGFFTRGLGNRLTPSSMLHKLASMLDSFFDHPWPTRIVYGTPLKVLLGTDLWAIADLPAIPEEEYEW